MDESSEPRARIVIVGLRIRRMRLNAAFYWLVQTYTHFGFLNADFTIMAAASDDQKPAYFH